MNKLQRIMTDIKRLEDELRIELTKKEGEFFYRIKGKKVSFEEEVEKRHKSVAQKLHSYIFNASMANIISIPFIWSCLIPAVFMDGVITFYQMICFPLYKIPKPQRSDYIIMDRSHLQYLNLIEKLNCAYCGYFNGLIAYVQEIGARTEQYWCPIKHARKMVKVHSRYHKFMEYGDENVFQELMEKVRNDYAELREDEKNKHSGL